MLHRRDFIKQTGIVLSGMVVPLPLFSSTINNKMKQENKYDVIIIGGSYSGLAAGMALGRALRNVLIIDGGNPCNKQTPQSHNFLTNDGKTPKEIASVARLQVSKYRSVRFLDDMVTSGIKNGNIFEVKTLSGEAFSAGKLIVATGIKDIIPNIPGFAECWGISVIHCPYCHGYEVRHQKTGILTNGDMAFEMSSLIFNWTKGLSIFTNGTSTLSVLQKVKLQKHKISIVETEIEQLEHRNGNIQNIVFKDGRKEPVKALYARPPFIQHSSIPSLLGCELTPEAYVKIDTAYRTTVKGVYACGDNTTRMRTIANAVSMGTTTGIMVNKELIEETF
jgi:thioredoxin reductase